MTGNPMCLYQSSPTWPRPGSTSAASCAPVAATTATTRIISASTTSWTSTRAPAAPSPSISSRRTPTPKLDNRVSLDDPRLRASLREIHARGHEIGFHPGYNTYRHPEAMARSVATLRRVLEEEGIDQPQLGGRQHYLRWETHTTARLPLGRQRPGL